MADIRPFRGWHYTGDVSDLIAPPFDQVDATGKRALLARSPDNVVGVDLPHVPPKDAGPDEGYIAAAEKLAALQAAGTVVQDEQPALYAYSQSYEWAGQAHTRRALMCGVRATEWYEGVWPHEQTYAGPRADRLKLTQQTRTQLSPIFGLFEDDGSASEALWAAVGDRPPVAWGRLNGVTERLWPVTDARTLDAVRRSLADAPIFIADGHHRYRTALNYRNTLRDAGRIDADHEANFVLFTLVAMDDPGLLVLPTHRLISGITDGFGCEELMAETRRFVRWRRLELSDELLDDPDAFLAPHGASAMAFLDAAEGPVCVGHLTDPAVMTELSPDKCPTWRGLAVAILQRLFLGRHIAPHVQGDIHPEYTAYGREAVQALDSGRCQMAVILQSTPLSAVEDIALARMVMPHKSTYFYPKLATGMVLKPLQ